jgi:predicted regulator of Ras-like GTPase activity (Roadblock/LC7/MglB family)
MPDTTGELNWLLDDLVGRVGFARQAMILSGDGLPMGMSRDITPADAEHLAALAAGFHSLARSVSDTFGGGNIRQTVIELEAAGPPAPRDRAEIPERHNGHAVISGE